MHEYAHHVEYEMQIIETPGGGHWLYENMADHYKSHYFKEINCTCSWHYFDESECKLKGNELAWSEGWATFFGIAAQKYYLSYLNNIKTVGDESYSSYNGAIYTFATSPKYGDACEGTIIALLYEMLDDSNNDYSNASISLGHREMWMLAIESCAITFQEFYDYFMIKYEKNLIISEFGKLLNYYGLAPSAALISNSSSNSVTLEWSNSLIYNSSYFNNNSYRLNFYDKSRNLIERTETISNTSFVINSNLLTSLKNDNVFYVSVTRYESNTPITCYESEWSILHFHFYTDRYANLNESYHRAYCSCGEYIEAAHIFKTVGQKTFCKFCGYNPQGPGIIPWPTHLNVWLNFYSRENEYVTE